MEAVNVMRYETASALVMALESSPGFLRKSENLRPGYFASAPCAVRSADVLLEPGVTSPERKRKFLRFKKYCCASGFDVVGALALACTSLASRVF